MIRPLPSGGIRLVTLGLLLAVGLLWVLPLQSRVAAQPNQEAKDLHGLTIEIDMEALLRDPDVLSLRVSGPIWTVAAPPGRQLIQVPVQITPGTEPVDLSSIDLKVGGASFLGWRLFDLWENKPRGDDRVEIERQLFQPPLFTKKITVYPETADGDRRVAFRVDRFLLGGNVNRSDRYYSLKLDQELLKSKQPVVPDRPGGNRDPAQRAADMQRQLKLRKDLQNFMDLRSIVNGLPSDIEVPLEPRIWAVFAISPFRSDLEITGHKEGEWSISLETFRTLRETSVRPKEGPRKAVALEDRLEQRRINQRAPAKQDPRTFDPVRDLQMINALAVLAADTHPYTQRMVAHAIAANGVARRAEIGDSTFFLMKKLLEGGDTEVRRTLLLELTSIQPPTPFSIALLPEAIQAEGKVQLAGFKQMLRGIQATDPAIIEQTARQMNDQLADPKGVPPSIILEEAIANTTANPMAFPVMIRTVNFARIPEERLNDALVTVVEYAGTDPIAAAWLNDRFLGSVDTELVRKTLDIILNADTGSKEIGPAVKNAMNLIFGVPELGGDIPIRRAKLRGLIPIDSTNHGMFRVLQFGDKRVREKAWKALPNFRITQNNQGGVGGAADPYAVLLDAALLQSPTPVEAAAFFRKQPDQLKAGAALINLVLSDTPAASIAASQTLVSSGMPLGDALSIQRVGERQGFAMKMYENLTDEVPMVTFMLRYQQKDSDLARWFGDEIADGRLPADFEWKTQLPHEVLIDLIGTRDRTLARGAVAVLVADIGGKRVDVERLADRFANEPNRERSNLESIWAKAKSDILIKRLQTDAGPYELVLNVFVPGQSQIDRVINVGVVQLEVQGDGITIGKEDLPVSLPSSYGIQFRQAADLRTFPEVAELTLNPQNTEPVILRPLPDGSFAGDIKQNGQVWGQLIMQRLEQRS